ncbi:MATE family efflux transporter [Turicimonas muris]|uniref:MATE family efflux transporter n=1 Tax=Turicimonas muris TaxID=1796652 RepID=UPI002494A836|nr:MATE family efflux transporter [Turicimonas muris]
MEAKNKRTENLFSLIREGSELTTWNQIELVWRLSLPAIFAQISFVMVQYIDAAMVGHLGANPAAAIGLVSSSLWLVWGLTTSVTAGFSVQVAQQIGAKQCDEARSVLRQALFVGVIFSILIALTGLWISPYLSNWLGGQPELCSDARIYFAIFCLGTPAAFLGYVASSMLRSTGNVKLPSVINIGMCFLDAIFNLLLIFPTSDYQVFGFTLIIPGADLGVAGAALGTILAETISTSLMLWFLLVKSDKLSLVGHKGSFLPEIFCIRRAFRIGSPIALERVAMSGAQIVTTMIVAPLGPIALAAHSFAITAESLCYMPGFGVADAASTIVGQSIGAKRPAIARQFAKINVLMVMMIMSAMGLVMYLTAPWMIGFMTADCSIINLGASVLRIEAFAEPMFAAAIVCCSIFVSAGYTLFPSLMNLGSMWLVRIPLAYFLASSFGLKGVWFAMATELCFRGAVFLFTLSRFDFSKRRGIEG